MKKFEFYKNDVNNWKNVKVNGVLTDIPSDWMVDKIKNQFKILNPKGEKEGLFPYLEIGDININKKYLIKNKPTVKGAKFVNKNTLLISTVRPNLEKITKTNENLYVSSAFGLIELRNNFLYYKILEKQFTNNLLKLVDDGTYPTIKKENIYSLNILLPSSIQEQANIASFLDSLNDNIEQLINKKENYAKQKQYFQQELLSGRLRIKLNNKAIGQALQLGYLKQYLLNEENEIIEYGEDKVENIKIEIVDGKSDEFENWLNIDFHNKIEFYKNDVNNWKNVKVNGVLTNIPSDWIVEKLNNIAKFQNGFSFNKSNYTFENTSFEIIEVGSISIKGCYNKNVKNIKYVDLNNIKVVQKYNLKINDIVIPMSDMSHEKKHVGTPYLIDKLNLYLNQRVGRIYDININQKYFYYSIKLNQKYFGINAQGQGPFNLGTKPILNYNFLYTNSILEQTLIAKHLTMLDDLIENYETKIELEKKKFKYFQQELLSGRLRIR